MVYVDACGNVSPCVFLPLSFGNVQNTPIHEIYAAMKNSFPTESRCFCNDRFSLIRTYHRDECPLPMQETQRLMTEVHFSPRARFFQLHGR
jgi:MoaA/NifB/PqqE/SkfB family radical SAM enzyme